MKVRVDSAGSKPARSSNRVRALLSRRRTAGATAMARGGEQHLSPRSQQKRVSQQIAEAGERVADGGLAEADAAARGADAALAEQGVEHDQQVQIEGCEAAMVHTKDLADPSTPRIGRFDRCIAGVAVAG